MNFFLRLLFLLTAGLLLCGQGHSWNALGHRLVAQIAIDQLDKPTVRQLNRLNHSLDAVYQPISLVNAAFWLDMIRYADYEWLTAYHYVDLPFTDDNSPLPTLSPTNVIRAIEMALKQLNSPKARAFDRGLALRILLHVLGDIHQPLHAAERISKAHPRGDQGGNLFVLASNSTGKNLHEYWDRGGGYLLPQKRVNAHHLKRMAQTLERQYPCSSFDLTYNPDAWAQSSHQLAVRYAYSTKENIVPPKDYQKKVQELSQRQIALAGCRLAKLLSNIKFY